MQEARMVDLPVYDLPEGARLEDRVLTLVPARMVNGEVMRQDELPRYVGKVLEQAERASYYGIDRIVVDLSGVPNKVAAHGELQYAGPTHQPMAYLGSYAVMKQALDTAPVEIEIQKGPDLMDIYQAMMK